MGIGSTGGKVGTGYVPIKPDASGFGADLERQVGNEATGAGGRLGGRASAAFAGAFAAGTATMAKGVLDFAGFDKQMREVFTLLPDITEPAMAEMTDQAKAFASEFGVLPTEVVPALYSSLSAGVPADNVFAFMETAQQLAKGGVTELETAVDGLSSVVNAYGADVIGAAEVSDLMFTAVKGGKTTVDELAGSLFQVVPTASAVGLEFGNVTAALATMTAAGTPTSVATTQLRQLLVELTKSGSGASDMFKELSGQSVQEFLAAGGDLAGVLDIMQQGADESGVALQDLFGSVEAGNAALSLTGANTDKFASELDAAAGSAGATQAAFDTMNTGLAATMDRLKARLSVSLINLGESLAPTIEQLGTGLAQLLDIFSALPQPMQTGIVLFGTLAAGALAFAGPMLKIIKLGGAMSKMFTLLAANPWTLVALAIAAAAYLIITNWDEVVEFLGDTWEWITDAAEATGRFFVGIWDAVTGAVVAAWDGMVTGIVAGAKGVATGVTAAAKGVAIGVTAAWDAVATATVATWDAVTGATVAAWDAVTGAVVAAWDAIVGAVSTAIDTVGMVISEGFAFVEGVVVGYLDLYRAAFQFAWDSITGVVSQAWENITGNVTYFGGLILDGISATWNAVLSTTTAIWDGITGAVSFAVGAIMDQLDDLKTVPDAISAAFSGLASAISYPFETAFQAIRTAWNNTVGGFSVGIPGVFGFGGVSFTIPTMAAGGVLTGPTMFLGGEYAGAQTDPEIVAPQSVIFATVVDALAQSPAGGVHVETHLHAEAGVDVSTLERMLERASTEVVRVVVRELDRNRLGAGQPRGPLTT